MPEDPKPNYVFEVGEKVKVLYGPFRNFIGIIMSINEEKGTLQMMVSLLGRTTPITLNFDQAEKI